MCKLGRRPNLGEAVLFLPEERAVLFQEGIVSGDAPGGGKGSGLKVCGDLRAVLLPSEEIRKKWAGRRNRDGRQS